MVRPFVWIIHHGVNGLGGRARRAVERAFGRRGAGVGDEGSRKGRESARSGEREAVCGRSSALALVGGIFRSEAGEAG